MDGVNIPKATFQAYIFQLFFGAGLACLMPFLSLYLRYLGLSASQVGLVLGAKAASTMIWAPCWTRCSTRFHKKRFVLMFSTFILTGSYLLMTIIPPANQEISSLKFCPKEYINLTLSAGNRSQGILSTVKSGDHSNNNIVSSKTSQVVITTAEVPTTPGATLGTSTEEMITESQRGLNDQEIVDQEIIHMLKKLHFSEKDLKSLSVNELNDLLNEVLDEDAASSTQRKYKEPSGHKRDRNKREAGDNDTKTEVVESTSTQSNNTSPSFMQGNIYDKVASIINKINKLPGQITTVINTEVFAAVLCLVIVAEMLCAPAEKLADDIWFEFLDSTDVLEKYGSHRMWFCLGFATMPPVITAIIDNTPCLLPKIAQFHINHILIHFYSFLVLMSIAFICTICYPIYMSSDGKKVLQRRSRFCRGIKLLFGDVHASLYSISVIVLGLLQGALYTFLFWQIQDKGGSELVMGLSITAAFGGEFFMITIQRWLVMKISYAASVVLGLFIFGARLVFYSFMWNPWLVLIGEGFHCFSSTIMWAAVRGYPDFRLNPLVMDRSANSVINALYQGFGLAPGCIIAGYVYDWVGPVILFQGASILATIWCLLFAILHRCKKRSTKVRYTKLLQEEGEDNMSDGSMEYDDDWLEVALKHQH